MTWINPVSSRVKRYLPLNFSPSLPCIVKLCTQADNIKSDNGKRKIRFILKWSRAGSRYPYPWRFHFVLRLSSSEIRTCAHWQQQITLPPFVFQGKEKKLLMAAVHGKRPGLAQSSRGFVSEFDSPNVGKFQVEIQSSTCALWFEVQLWDNQQPLDKTVVTELACVHSDNAQRKKEKGKKPGGPCCLIAEPISHVR
jgi:hypothetical protein